MIARKLLTLSLSLLALAATPALSHAEDPHWLDAERLSPLGGDSLAPRVGVDASGRGVAAWVRRTGVDDVVEVADREPGQRWQPAQERSAHSPEIFGVRASASLARGAIVTWVRRAPTGRFVVEYIRRSPDGEWDAGPTPLSDPNVSASNPDLAHDGSGNDIVVWEEFDGSTRVIRSALGGLDGDWYHSTLSDPNVQSFAPEVEISYSAVHVVWHEGRELKTVHWLGEGAWSNPETVSIPGDRTLSVSIDANDRGDAVLAYTAIVNGGEDVFVSRRPIEKDEWSYPVPVSSPGAGGSRPDVAITSAGRPLVVWSGLESVAARRGAIEYSTFQNRGWTRPRPIVAEDATLYDFSDLKFDTDDNAWLVFRRRPDGDQPSVVAAHRPAGAADWSLAKISHAVPVSDTEIAPDNRGGALAIWRRGEPGDLSVEAARFGIEEPEPKDADDPLSPNRAADRSGGNAPPVRDQRAPSIGRPTLGMRVFIAARRGASIARSGTTLTFSLSENARVTFAVERRKQCRHGRRCRAGRLRKRLTYNGRAGVNRVRFTGRLAGRKLAPGRYRLTLQAVDAAGNRSSVRKVSFRIKPGLAR